MTKTQAKKYTTRFSNCYKRDCFVPFTGNGQPICRLYELGQCKGEARGTQVHGPNDNRKRC